MFTDSDFWFIIKIIAFLVVCYLIYIIIASTMVYRVIKRF